MKLFSALILGVTLLFAGCASPDLPSEHCNCCVSCPDDCVSCEGNKCILKCKERCPKLKEMIEPVGVKAQELYTVKDQADVRSAACKVLDSRNRERGSGTIVSLDRRFAIVMTNAHVTDRQPMKVQHVKTGQLMHAATLVEDATVDVAFLLVSSVDIVDDAKAIPFSHTGRLQAGEKVVLLSGFWSNGNIAADYETHVLGYHDGTEILLSGQSAPGASGSALIGWDEIVIRGIHWGHIPNKGISLARDATLLSPVYCQAERVACEKYKMAPNCPFCPRRQQPDPGPQFPPAKPEPEPKEEPKPGPTIIIEEEEETGMSDLILFALGGVSMYLLGRGYLNSDDEEN